MAFLAFSISTVSRHASAFAPDLEANDPPYGERLDVQRPDPLPAPEPRVEEAAGEGDELVLVSGGFIRGRVVEMTPGERIVIETSDGALREFAWTEIEIIRRGSEPEPRIG